MKLKLAIAAFSVQLIVGCAGAPSEGGGGSFTGGSPSGGSFTGGGVSSGGSGAGPDGSGGMPIQPGTLTSGDYDDVLNANLYQDYISDYLQSEGANKEIPFVDISQKIPVAVVGAEGKPIFGATVEVIVNEDVLVSLKTPVNGVVNLYPLFDQLPESFDLKVSSAQGEELLTHSVVLADTQEQINLTLPVAENMPSSMDITLVIDVTGSMSDELRYLQIELSEVFKELERQYPQLDIAAGLVGYRDFGDEYVVADYPLTSDFAQFDLDLNSLRAAGGGDYPEAMDRAMATAMDMPWREEALKVVLLVADAPPHDDKFLATWASVVESRKEQIHIVPIAASGAASSTEFLMRSMAAITNSRYIFLTDDSGVGNEHDEPDVDCYIVTRLDSTVRRILASLITGNRVEPQDEEIIRQEGEYDAGVCTEPEQIPAGI